MSRFGTYFPEMSGRSCSLKRVYLAVSEGPAYKGRCGFSIRFTETQEPKQRKEMDEWMVQHGLACVVKFCSNVRIFSDTAGNETQEYKVYVTSKMCTYRYEFMVIWKQVQASERQAKSGCAVWALGKIWSSVYCLGIHSLVIPALSGLDWRPQES